MPRQPVASWIAAHLFASLFTTPEQWLAECRRILPFLEPRDDHTRLLRDLAQDIRPDDPRVREEYGRLFWDEDADCRLPLWASAARKDNPVLVDETTLAVVRTYNCHGFTPQPDNGNPPDYLGTMFEFVEYLHAWDMHLHDAGAPVPEDGPLAVRDDFFSLYMAENLFAVGEAVTSRCRSPFFRAFVEWMRLAVTAMTSHFATSDDFPESILDSFPSAPIRKNGPNRPVFDKPLSVVHTGGVGNCGGRCPFDVHVQEDCVLRFVPGNSLGNPLLRPCIRIHGHRQLYFSSDRLRHPLLRVGKRGEGRFKRIGWDEALDRIAAEWVRIRDRYGPASRFVLYGTGMSSWVTPGRIMKRLLNLDGGFLDGYNTYSEACAVHASMYTYGDARTGNSPQDHANAKLILLWGHNPEETLFGIERKHFLAAAKKNGARIIVIDPRQSDSALAYADAWIPLLPSTDSALADGMAYVIWTEGLFDREFMDAFCLGFDEDHMPPGAPPGGSYEQYLFGKQDGIVKTPEWASSITNVPADVIRKLAREYATTKPACLLPGWGPQRTGNGEQTVRSQILLACLTGNVGVPGGGSAGAGWVNRHAESAFPAGKSPYPGEIPNFLWTTAISDPESLTPASGLRGVSRLDSGIRMLFCLASNTLVNQHSDVNNSIRIISNPDQCECIVASDLFMTPSARYADIVLPAASAYEGENITGPWSYGDYLMFNNQVRPPLFESRFEWDWIRPLAQRLGHGPAFEDGKPAVSDWLPFLYGQVQRLEPELPPYSDFKKNGGYDYKNRKNFIAYQPQRQDPVNNPFPTPSGKIEIFSPRLHALNNPAEIPAIPKYVPCPEGPEDPLRQEFPLQLIGWHTRRRTHSTHDNSPTLAGLEPQRLWLHPADAAPRNIRDNDMVEVYNNRGKIHIRVTLTARITPGVVALPQGAWHSPNKSNTDTRGNINTLTHPRPTPLAHANPQHSALVQVSKLELR